MRTAATGVAILLAVSCGPAPDAPWVRVPCPITDPLHNGYFLDNQYGWIVTYGTGRVLRTEDGGTSWSLAATLEPQFYEDLYFLTPEEGWLCGEGGVLLHTTDGGRSWDSRRVGSEQTAHYGIDFGGSDRAFLVGMDMGRRRASFFESRDRGQTWHARSDSLDARMLEPIQFLNAGRGFIAGNRAVLRTNDGGASWQECDVGVQGTIRGLHMLDERTGWVVGHNGLVLRTSDGGQTWIEAPSFTTNRLRGVRFLDAMEGYIVGDRDQQPGSLWRTRDGGASWQAVPSVRPNLHRLLISPKALWAVGDSGTILRRPR